MDPREKLAEQRKQVWGAAQSVLGCGGLIAVMAGIYWAVGRLPDSVTPEGPDVTVFIERSLTNNNLFWFLLVGTLFLFLILGTVKSNLGVLLACAAYLVLAWGVIAHLYTNVAAIAFIGNVIELRYVWPRPSQRLPAAEVLSVKSEESVRTSDDHLMEYRVVLHTKRGDYETFNNPSDRRADETVRRITALGKR